MSNSASKGTALITGASTGIGAIYADRLARRGYDLILVARDEVRLNALAKTLRAATGRSVDVLKADLASRAGRAAVEQVLATDPAITALVNNAGMAANGTLVEVNPDTAETMIELNVIAVARLAAAAAGAFAARKFGTIINIASVLALAPEQFNGIYSGTKAFVLNLTLSMHQELAASGVKIQAVLPGATRTEIWERSGMDIGHLPSEMLMDADAMVDAALVGLDRAELVTIPSLPDPADYDALTKARFALGPNLSRSQPAARYELVAVAAQ